MFQRTCASQSGKALFLVLATLAVAALALGAYFLLGPGAGKGEAELSSEGVRFEVVEAANPEFDGSPALSLAFSLPLDARQDYGKFIQVLEMPARAKDSGAGQNRSDDEGEEEGHPPAGDGQASRNDADTALEGGQPVAGAWVVGDNPRMLYFPHIKPQTRYVVQVMAGLPARGALQSEEEVRFSIRTAAVAQAFYFASRGMVLPAAQNGGLPVVTVNVPEVDIQFLKVKTEQMPAFLEKVLAGPVRRSAPEEAATETEEGEEDEDGADSEGYNRSSRLRGAVDVWELDQIHRMTESVFNGRFLTEPKADKRSVSHIPVEDIAALREPGIYVAVMSQPNRFRYEYQTTYFYVSDLGLHVRQYTNSGADAYVSSLASGKALRGVEVSWLNAGGRVLARAETDGDGRARFDRQPAQARLLMARQGQQMSLIAFKEPALDLAEFDVGGRLYTPVRLFAWSGRDLYRPGEHFEVSVLARDADGGRVPAQPIQAILRRPDGKPQWTASWPADAQFEGYYRKRIELPADAATGSWRLELRADPAARVPGTVLALHVEEFLPERMKLDLSSARARLAADADAEWAIQVEGRYLYGAPATGNRLLGVSQIERDRQPLAKKLPGFVFGDANEDTVRSRNELDEQALDEQGRAAVAVDLQALAGRQSPFRVRTTLSLLESGGRPVVRSIERTWWPKPVLIGLRPLFEGETARENASVAFEVVRADADARLHAADGLPVRLFRENRDYYWRFDDQRGWHSGFTETDELVATTQLSFAAGARGRLSLPVQYGRYRVEVIDPESGLVNRFRFYAGWSAKDDETQGVRPDRVALKLDKPAYADGESARLTITPPHAGEALVTVEGDRALWVQRLTLPAAGKTLTIPLDKAWKRHDLYVSVMVLRPGQDKDRITPARAFGLIHLPLERAARKIDVALDAPQKMEPERALKVRVKAPAAAGEKALVTLSAVDAGILNITRFATPDPFDFFFGKLRYGAEARDLYGRIIEKLAGQKGKLKWGGDTAPRPTQSLPKKVRLVDLFSGPVALDAQGEAEISLPVPDFNGSLRLMAVVSSGERYGSQEAEVTVAAPLVVELATPRFLSVGDSALIALDVHNLSGAAQQVSIRVDNPDGLVIRGARQELNLQDQQKRTVRIPLEAGRAMGLTEVQVEVGSARGKFTRRFPLMVQAPTPRQSVIRHFTVEPGESLEIRDAALGGLLHQSVTGTLTVSDRAPIDVRSAIQGLLAYPYGCTEQVTSRAYPHVFVDAEAARQFGLKPFTTAERAEQIDQAIARLSGMQAPNGGFSLWGNFSESQYWLTAYVADFLIDAREQGFRVPQEVEDRALQFLLRGLQEGVATLPRGVPKYNLNAIWNDYRFAGSGRFGVLAYGGYVLARQGKAPLATLRQLHDLREAAYSGLGLVQLGLALDLMGDAPRARRNIEDGLAKPRSQASWWGDYGSELRDLAMIHVLLERHPIEGVNTQDLIPRIAAEMSRNRYYSTQEKLALFLLGRQFAKQKTGSWQAEIDGADAPVKLAGRGAQFQPLEAGEIADGLVLRNTHDQRLYAELQFSGNPAQMPPARNDAFVLQRLWYTADGQPLAARPLRVGESILVRLKVRANGRHANGMVVDYLPAGLEVENANLVQGEQMPPAIDRVYPHQAMADTRIKHVEFRDDRFVVAARLEGEMNFFYRARVVTPGRFVMPPIYAEDMYQPQIYGLAGGGWMLEVNDDLPGGR